MVVPYLRNPNRYRSHPVAIKTKSQYHLEPDHARSSYYEPSTYKHVGRRTKGGGGSGGYLFYSNGSNTAEGEGPKNPAVFWTIAIFVLVLITLCIAYCIIEWICAICSPLCSNQESQQLEVGRSEQQQHDVSAPETIGNYPPPDRKQLIRSKLQYTVFTTSDKSNAKDDSREDDGTEASEDSLVVSSYVGKPSAECGSSSSTSAAYAAIKNLVSSWSFRPPRSGDVCSICLEQLQVGQTICKSNISICNHTFHEECIESWLMNHDYCPLCRSNMVGENGILHL